MSQIYLSDPNHSLDPKAFLSDFHHTTQFGATAAGGIDRQAGTEAHGAVRDWFRARASKLGFTVKVDNAGNLYALRTWDASAPYVLVGSHLDSQPLGGRFDGTYGVVAALHAAHAVATVVDDQGIVPTFNLAIVDWFNEEGARFAPSIMGSSVFAGLIPLEEILGTQDAAGISVREALSDIGYLGEEFKLEPAAYAEIHVEQGRRLERADIPIGVVTESWYTQKLLVTVIGEQSHTGATLMADRRDALIAASLLVQVVEQVVDEFPPESIVTSVGKFDVFPNSPIVVPRKVDLVIDLRADEADYVHRARESLLKRMNRIAAERDVEIHAQDFDVRPVQRFPQEAVDLASKAACDGGFRSMTLKTLAGHDSVAMNRITPSVMMFVPSVDGVSHCEREYTSDADMVSGLHVLTTVVQRLVNGELDQVAPGGDEVGCGKGGLSA